MGIIPYNVQAKLSYGEALNDEDKTQIKNNHNIQKSLLDEGMLVQVEAILKQIGIDLVEQKPEVVLPTGEQSQPKSAVEKWLENALNNVKGIKDKLTGEIPSLKLTTEQKEAIIPTMSNDELYNALKGLDPSDPIYKSLYDEAIKRGLITR